MKTFSWKKMNTYASGRWQMTSNLRKWKSFGASGACRSSLVRANQRQSGRWRLIAFCQLKQIEDLDSARDWLSIFHTFASISWNTVLFWIHHTPFKFRLWRAIPLYQFWVGVTHGTRYWCRAPIASVHQGARRSHYKISQTTAAEDCVWIFQLDFSGFKSHQLIKKKLCGEITFSAVSCCICGKETTFDSNCPQESNKSCCDGRGSTWLCFLQPSLCD